MGKKTLLKSVEVPFEEENVIELASQTLYQAKNEVSYLKSIIKSPQNYQSNTNEH